MRCCLKYNNHPFLGKCGETSFALAHNGVLYNDRRLRCELNLPQTAIETDSYVAVQLLEKHDTLDMKSVAKMTEPRVRLFSRYLTSEKICISCGAKILLRCIISGGRGFTFTRALTKF